MEISKIEVLEKDYGIKMNEELRKEIREMCNLDEYVANRGREEGLKKGKAEGLAQGIEKTTLEFSKFIQKKQLYQNNNWLLFEIPFRS